MKSVIKFTDHNRRFKVIDMKNYQEVHSSGLHKNWDNCRAGAYEYAKAHDLTVVHIVHV